jgi:hypothetical protein
MSYSRILSKFLHLEYYSSGKQVEYQSCQKFYDRNAHRVSAPLDFCSQSYRSNTIAQSSTAKTEKQRTNFLTILTIDLALDLNTKVVDH